MSEKSPPSSLGLVAALFTALAVYLAFRLNQGRDELEATGLIVAIIAAISFGYATIDANRKSHVNTQPPDPDGKSEAN